jgi:periplasmic protein TonB
MRLNKANIAGLSSPLQQAEMKSILAGAWPPLKPLPVFKYETVDYRATVDFDKKRGEWVCRKTSLPSNKVQELRGGLREITLALPHSEAEIFTEAAEQQEQELEKDTNRRLQAIHEWRENYQSGALYCELRDYLSESQQTEMDDSLRLSLTARQLQFTAKNVAYVFEVLSTAGGRFATLIEFAKRSKAKQGTAPEAQGKEPVPEAERTMDQDRQSSGSSSREFRGVPDGWLAGDEDAGERCRNMDEVPAVSITSALSERDQASSAVRMALDTASQQSEIEASEIVETNSSVIEHAYQEGLDSPAFSSFQWQVRTGQSSADGIEGAPSRCRALEISGFQLAVFGTLFLLAVLAFAVGLTVGRGPLRSRFREVPKSMLADDTNPPAQSDQADESTSLAPTPPVANSNYSALTRRLDQAGSAEEKSKDSDSVRTTESKASAKPEVNSDRSGAMTPIAPRSPAPQWLTPNISAAPHLPRPSAILVTPPSRGSQPFRVNFREKAVAATSSFAMTSQLSVLVSVEPGASVARKPSRLEAGELESFVWPQYPRPRNRYGLAEIIKVRATIGQLGQVLEVRFLSGSNSLLPATTRAVRQWRYRPTLLDNRPVQAQQDITIEFRPPQYSPKVSSQHPSHR